MSGTPSPSDFDARLAAALNKARASASGIKLPGAGKAAEAAKQAAGAAGLPGAASAAAAAGAPLPADEFSSRIASALQRASGPAPAGATESREEQQQESGGPVGVGDYLVREGDCVASIAVGTGHFWETVWTHPANADLNRVRKDPYILLPQDRVTIPPLRRKDEPIAPEQRHRFKRRGCPERLIVVFRDENEPRANQRYLLRIDNVEIEGVTDPNGRVEVFIPPDARQGEIEFPDSGGRYELELGHLDPISELSGVQGRLLNLGLYDGPVDNRESEQLEQSLRAFQVKYELENTGKPDQRTRDKLQEVFGS